MRQRVAYPSTWRQILADWVDGRQLSWRQSLLVSWNIKCITRHRKHFSDPLCLAPSPVVLPLGSDGNWEERVRLTLCNSPSFKSKLHASLDITIIITNNNATTLGKKNVLCWWMSNDVGWVHTKHLLFREISAGKCSHGEQKKCYKDSVKSSLKLFSIDMTTWETKHWNKIAGIALSITAVKLMKSAMLQKHNVSTRCANLEFRFNNCGVYTCFPNEGQDFLCPNFFRQTTLSFNMTNSVEVFINNEEQLINFLCHGPIYHSLSSHFASCLGYFYIPSRGEPV